MRTLVAMSGGVDSSVAALLVSEMSGKNNTWGVHMVLHEPTVCDLPTRSCCNSVDALDAQSIATKLGIYYDELNMISEFEAQVFNPFIESWRQGRVGQPCMDCNFRLKFDLLFKYADSAGYDLIATGHYIGLDDQGIYIADDTKKDQSYFLWQIDPSLYSRLYFPLGSMNKLQVRAIAETNGFVTAKKPDSQNICFAPQGYQEVLKNYLPETPGNIVDLDGNILGTHTGYWKFVSGQRHGIPVNGRYYVSRVDPETNTVVVSPVVPATCVFEAEFVRPVSGDNLFVKVRSGPTIAPCTVVGNQITTQTPVVASPGQAAVVYQLINNRYYLVSGGYIK